MTTINLVSPSTNGYDFNVRFREPVLIPKNAKVYLNFASFSRDSEIYFKDNQVVSLTELDLLPNVKPHDTAVSNIPNTSSFTIPVVNATTGRRGYTFQQLSDTMTIGMGNLRDNNAQFEIYEPIEYDKLLNNQYQVGVNDNMAIGFYTEGGANATEGILREDFVIDTLNNRNADISGATNGEVYIKSNATDANLHYDSYAVSNNHYHSFQAICTNDLDKINNNIISCSTNVDMADQQGAISIGLYCKEFVDTSSAFSGWAEKTKGVNSTTAGGVKINPALFHVTTQQATTSANFATNSRNCKLASFLTIEITPSTFSTRNKSKLKILMPKNVAGDWLRDWTDINQQIGSMNSIAEFSLASIYGNNLEQLAKISFHTYIFTGNDDWKDPTKRRLYFRVYVGDTINNSPIYDSIDHGHYFADAFFTGMDVTGQTQSRNQAVANSQIPFSIIVSAQAIDEGFEQINYPVFDKSQGSNHHPLSVLGSYNINFTQELALILGNANSGKLFPNVCEMNTQFFFYDNIINDWKNNNFDIYINNLPIRNYKNKEDSGDGGFAKSILASVPAPFMNTQQENIRDNKIITGVYQPSIMSVLQLNNQEISINNFDVSIKRGNTDEPASALQKSNICFTITE
tara:strand:- start:934 stop:2823 length:1890 start_codon:yes stop_codon:yes gene_type:complete